MLQFLVFDYATFVVCKLINCMLKFLGRDVTHDIKELTDPLGAWLLLHNTARADRQNQIATPFYSGCDTICRWP